jgi:signal peptidase I
LTSARRIETSAAMLRAFSRRKSDDNSGPPAADRESTGSTLRFIAILVLLAWAVRSLVVAPFSIPSGSMLPTLYVGDYVMVAKWPYGYSRYSFPFGFPAFEGRIFERLPKRGDVVVFRHPSEDTDLIKRVIGLPGDTIEVRGGGLMLNGKPLDRQQVPRFKMRISPNSPCKVVPPATAFIEAESDRSYCIYPAYRETLPGGPSYTVLDQVDRADADNRPPTTVPAGHVFLMGDNRDDSLDSRYSPVEGGIGFVPVERLIGRGLATFWSTDGSASYWKPWTWFTALRGERIGNGYTGDPE